MTRPMVMIGEQRWLSFGFWTAVIVLLPVPPHHLSSIDKFQGKDADCVIISFAKANANFGLGLLDDPKRLNVALSRAKRKLVLVGAKDVLAAKSPVFARLLQKASDDAALFTVDDATLPRLPARVPAAETPGAPPHGACG